MMTPIKKAARGFKTTTATATHNATYFIAASARQTSAGAIFNACPDQLTYRLEYRVVGPRDTIRIGASHTIDNAGNLPDSEVFSRPEFEDVLNFERIYGFGAGSVYPQGRQHGVIHVTKPSSTRCPSQAASGFQSHNGAETMTTVNTPTTPKTGNPSPLIRQQAIENALGMALFHIRKGDTYKAVAKSIRAASMLKQACAEIQNGGAA